MSDERSESILLAPAGMADEDAAAREERPESSLFAPYRLGPTELRNRVVMAPMTRSRAIDLVPNESMALYYRQRAGAGLIVTEGVTVSQEARGYAYTPGIYSAEQVAGWRQVVEAVHDEGGAIFAQLWHVGRQSHRSHQPGQGAPVSSMPVSASGVVFAFDETGAPRPLPVSEPRPLETEEVGRVTADFVHAAWNAMEAGFDGVELHGANGYLFDQFMNGALNQRQDRYGGSIENRLRFTLETVDAVAAAIGPERTGIRLAPFGRIGDLDAYSDEAESWLTLMRELSERGLAYVHLSNQGAGEVWAMTRDDIVQLRDAYSGTLILNGGLERTSGQDAIDEGLADLVAMGRPFIANPDLVERYRNGWPLADPDASTFYSGGAKGYIDYPEYTVAALSAGSATG